MKRVMLAIAAMALLVGCLPIEVDVTSDGRIVIARAEGFVYYDPVKGKVSGAFRTSDEPLFAQAVPQRGGIVAVTQPRGGGMGAQQTLHYVNDKREGKKLHSASNITYMQVSPDGDSVSFTRVADQQAAGFEENLPELHVLSIGGGARKITDALGVIHRWAPDSKSLYIVKLESKDAETELYSAKLMRIDPVSGKGNPLAQLVGPNELQMDVAPQGDQVLFTATAAGQLGKALPKFTQEDTPAVGLFLLDVKAGTVKQVRESAEFAFFSPEQTKVLIGSEVEGELKLEVTNIGLTRPVTIATDVVSQAGSDMAGGVSIYPTWYDDKTVLYIGKRAVFGAAAENFVLTAVSADGKQRKVHQPAIDAPLMK